MLYVYWFFLVLFGALSTTGYEPEAAWGPGWALAAYACSKLIYMASGQNSGNLPKLVNSSASTLMTLSRGSKMLPLAISSFWADFKSIIFLYVVTWNSRLLLTTCMSSIKLWNLRNYNKISFAGWLNLILNLFLRYLSTSKLLIRSFWVLTLYSVINS